jgi:acylaminoacyl-peptidase
MRTILCSIACLAGAVSASAQNRLAPADLFELEWAADVQISPDGQWVAYVRRFPDIMTDRYYSNLWLVKADGSENRPLTTGKFLDTSPRWSPDGKRLAYVSTRDGSPQIQVRWITTGQTMAVTNVSEPPGEPVWSPNGEWIAFLKLAPQKALVVGEAVTAPTGAQWATPAKYTDKLAFRWDGQGEVPAGYRQVFVVPAAGGTARQVTTGNFHVGSAFGGGAPAWSTDGAALYVSSNRRPDWERTGNDTEIFEVSVATGAMKPLTNRRGPDDRATPSPDGKLIAYLGFDEKGLGSQNTVLYLMNRDGTGSRAITTSLDRSVGEPRWAADGKGIYAMYDDQGMTKLALFGLDGSHRPIAADIGTGASAYGGGTYSLAADGSVAFTASPWDRPGDVAVARAGQPAKLLTDLNGDLFAGKELGRVEEIWYPSSKDQRRIQGWIIKPPGFDPAKKYPLAIEIHGGPFADYGPRFDAEKQVMAAAGYVVLYVNPRGSTSYGEAFTTLIHHNYPSDDFFDLNSGVDAVIAKGYVDPNRLYVTGGSGGGVLSAWMIGRTDRFKAALIFYPVINWETFTLTADMAARSASNWFPGLPWDQRENYWQRSLLSVVKNVKTPALIMTGEEDFRTPMSESEQYYKALKLQGKEAVLVRVPGESHGIRGRPSHWIAKLTTMTAWFASHS